MPLLPTVLVICPENAPVVAPVNAPVIASAPGNVYAPAPNVPAVTRLAGTAPADKVPTDVNEDSVTLLASVVPDNVPAAAVTVTEPPRETVCELIVTNEFARKLFAIGVPCHTPVTIVPTAVNEDVTTLLASVVPVSVPAAAGTVIAALPSKLTPLIARAVANVVAVVALPVNAAVTVPAVKLPLASRATIAEAVLALVAVVALLLTLLAVEIVARNVSAIAVNPVLIAPAVSVPTAVMPVYDPATRAVLTVPLDKLLALSVVSADPLVPLTHTDPL